MTYARRAKEYFRQMKAADPAIKIGVVAAVNWKERAGVLLDALKQMQIGSFITEGYQGWTPKMLATLKELGVTPDFAVCHRYPVSLSGWENDASLLQSTAQWTADAAALRRQLKTYYSYGIPQDEAARTGSGSPDIAQASFTGAAVEFSRAFPPYSATVIVLSPLRGG